MESIVLDQDPRFMTHFWEIFQRAMGTRLMMSTTFHPQTDNPSEDHPDVRGHATECVLDLKGRWEKHLPLVNFAYNNSYQASIQMTPYEALYGRPCRSLVCWTEVRKRTTMGLELVRDTYEKVDLIRKHLLTA